MIVKIVSAQEVVGPEKKSPFISQDVPAGVWHCSESTVDMGEDWSIQSKIM